MALYCFVHCTGGQVETSRTVSEGLVCLEFVHSFLEPWKLHQNLYPRDSPQQSAYNSGIKCARQILYLSLKLEIDPIVRT